MKIRIITYKRKSSKEEVDREEPLARQNILIDRARQWRGQVDREELVAELVDDGISGSTDRRQGFQRLISMAKANEFDRAYIGITSRLFRDLPNGPELLFQLREVLGKEIIFGDLLISQEDPHYKRFEAQRFLDGQTTSIEGSIGAKTGQEQLFKDGFKVGGRARYGYRLKRVPRGRDRKGNQKFNSLIDTNPHTFPVAQEILIKYASGSAGVRAIATDLNQRGIPSPSAWDSWGDPIAHCSKCRYSEKKELAVNPLCPKCGEILIFPEDSEWTKEHVLGIISEAEWTYSGHYRANYYKARIKHGEMAGKYKGGTWEGEAYRGEKLKPTSEWRIRRDNHPAAIDAATCARILERRNRNKNATPGGRRRAEDHPFPVVCGVCGSLYSRRGEGLLACSGRDRKIKECNNRAIKEMVLYPFVAHSLKSVLFKDPEALIKRTKELIADRKSQIVPDIRLKERELADRKKVLLKYQNLFESDRLDPELFAERYRNLKKEIGLLEETIDQMRRSSMGDSTTINAGKIFEKLYSGSTLKSPDAMKRLSPFLKNLISYTRLQPPDISNKKRTIEVFYSPSLAPALNTGVPKGIPSNFTADGTVPDLTLDLQCLKFGSVFQYVTQFIIILALLLGFAGAGMAYEDLSYLEFRTPPTRDLPTYWASYIKMFYVLDQDRVQTIKTDRSVREVIRPEGRIRLQTRERNPFLSATPSPQSVNLLFSADLLIPYLLRDFPGWVQASIAESIAETESMLIAQNKAMQNEVLPFGWPIAIVITFSF